MEQGRAQPRWRREKGTDSSAAAPQNVDAVPLPVPCLLSLAPEAASLGEACLSSRGLAQHGGAGAAEYHRRRVREHGVDLEAAGALHVHEEGVGALHETVQLVLTRLELGRRIQKVVIDRHGVCGVSCERPTSPCSSLGERGSGGSLALGK